jgi:hypothetical protein
MRRYLAILGVPFAIAGVMNCGGGDHASVDAGLGRDGTATGGEDANGASSGANSSGASSGFNSSGGSSGGGNSSGATSSGGGGPDAS